MLVAGTGRWTNRKSINKGRKEEDAAQHRQRVWSGSGSGSGSREYVGIYRPRHVHVLTALELPRSAATLLQGLLATQLGCLLIGKLTTPCPYLPPTTAAIGLASAANVMNGNQTSTYPSTADLASIVTDP